MPPVAALGVRVVEEDGTRLRLSAPLSANVNDKGCAFGGSLVSLMTLAGWGLVVSRLHAAGIAADVFVADSQVRYLAPLYADLLAEAEAADPEDWEAMFEGLRGRGRGRIAIEACVPLPEGGPACTMQARFAAIAKR